MAGTIDEHTKVMKFCHLKPGQIFYLMRPDMSTDYDEQFMLCFDDTLHNMRSYELTWNLYTDKNHVDFFMVNIGTGETRNPDYLPSLSSKVRVLLDIGLFQIAKVQDLMAAKRSLDQLRTIHNEQMQAISSYIQENANQRERLENQRASIIDANDQIAKLKNEIIILKGNGGSSSVNVGNLYSNACGLNFDTLRAGNIHRLPQFKNSKGEPAHSEHDGSDWTLGDWVCALAGEVGEAANIIKKITRGDIDLDEARDALGREFADVVTYLDLLAYQCGINLAQYTISKFNEVSARVGATTRINQWGVSYITQTGGPIDSSIGGAMSDRRTIDCFGLPNGPRDQM